MFTNTLIKTPVDVSSFLHKNGFLLTESVEYLCEYYFCHKDNQIVFKSIVLFFHFKVLYSSGGENDVPEPCCMKVRNTQETTRMAVRYRGNATNWDAKPE